ncbi:MAG: hypothetical protein JST84_05045 [Acidobacteria bacterium]|nr:hypothetical protein [Acidobacteriota bacterium]
MRAKTAQIKYLVAADPDKVADYCSQQDFFWAKPGEIVTLGAMVCTDTAKRQACGCGRSLGDITTMSASTLLIVVEGDLAALRSRFNASPMVEDYNQMMSAEIAWKDLVEPLLMAANQYPVGKVLRVAQSPTSFQFWAA